MKTVLVRPIAFLTGLAGLLAFGAATPAAQAQSDISIQVQSPTGTVFIGDTVQYHVTVTNFGPGTVTNLNGAFGPDNSDSAPSASTDKYTSFVSSDPAPFFTDQTNFRYVRVRDENGAVVTQLPAGKSGTFDVYFKATAAGTARRLFNASSPDDQSTLQNNSTVVETVIVAPPGPSYEPYTFITVTNGGTGSLQFGQPKGVAAGANDASYVADSNRHRIRKIFGSTPTTLAGSTDVAGSNDGTGQQARFNGPRGVALDASENVFVADTGNHTIRRIGFNAAVTTFAGTAGSSGATDGTGSAARFSSPQGLTVASGGVIYVADTGNHLIRKITSAGAVTTIAGGAGAAGSNDGLGLASRFNGPVGIAVDLSGNVFVADTSNHTIRKITPTGEVTT
ncbi:MAG TPA: hypothetical protein VF846_19615, partial [Thermoanaerobaculia bacterium]